MKPLTRWGGALERVGDAWLLTVGEAAPRPVDLTADAVDIVSVVGADGLAEARAAERLPDAGQPPPPPTGRPGICYSDGFGRGVRGGWWLFGRTLRLSGADGTQDADVDLVAVSGLPADHGLRPELAASALAAARARAPLPCACGTGAPSPEHHGSVRTLASAQDTRAPVEVRAQVGACTVCGARWVFEYAGDPYYEVRETTRPSRV